MRDAWMEEWRERKETEREREREGAWLGYGEISN